MSSIIEGYNYDIFISYRQKDNKHDGWVTEFVSQLKGELEATFKEDISIYFDENPSDGLLETHSVDKSLEGKLKCLIFIPIISQTYCDSKSYAWQHEFCAFNKFAKEDQFGRDIRLASGNVASRILPVKIHDLDPEDKTLLENELGVVLRSIEFIYKSAGVNRPINPSDNPDKNLSKTFYRDQINKVANAVKEIITALKKQINHPEEVLKQGTEVKSTNQKNLRTKIIITSVLILALIALGYFLVTKLLKPNEELEKSIAVLPFINDSGDQENTYFINGIMEEVLNNLQKIKDFRVLSRTSTEQYRGTALPTIPKIAKDLGINYIVEGSGQKYGNKFVLRVQLLVAKKEKHLWSKSYEQEIHETTDIINVQNQIAQSIAAELNAIMTPEEKQIIEKIPTANLTAYDFYERGKEEQTKFENDNKNKIALLKAEVLYHKALKYDSTFAQAWTGLATVYWDKHFWQEYFLENFVDSVLILANIALSYNDQTAEAFCIRGNYYWGKSLYDNATEEYDKALKINPNSWEAYLGKGNLYWFDDPVKCIENFQKAASLNRGTELPNILRSLSVPYSFAGFIEKSKYYELEALKLDGDSAEYYIDLAELEFSQANYINQNYFLLKAYAIDSTRSDLYSYLGGNYMYLHQYDKSLKYYKKRIESLKVRGSPDLWNMHRFGYAYWQNGYKKEANYYFDKQIEDCNNEIKLKRFRSRILFTYFDLAATYAFRGEKKKAYENLRIFNQRQSEFLYYVTLIKNDPLFESIRKEPEFQQIVRDIEAKYQAEHERVRKWLEENKML